MFQRGDRGLAGNGRKIIQKLVGRLPTFQNTGDPSFRPPLVAAYPYQFRTQGPVPAGMAGR